MERVDLLYYLLELQNNHKGHTSIDITSGCEKTNGIDFHWDYERDLKVVYFYDDERDEWNHQLKKLRMELKGAS